MRERLPQVPAENVIAEPMGRDTAAAIGLGAAAIFRRDPDATIVSTHADQLIEPASKLRADRSPNPQQRDTNAAALEFGGGVDVRGFGWVGFRADVRDVYTGARAFSLETPHNHVHNVVASGGFVVRF